MEIKGSSNNVNIKLGKLDYGIGNSYYANRIKSETYTAIENNNQEYEEIDYSEDIFQGPTLDGYMCERNQSELIIDNSEERSNNELYNEISVFNYNVPYGPFQESYENILNTTDDENSESELSKLSTGLNEFSNAIKFHGKNAVSVINGVYKELMVEDSVYNHSSYKLNLLYDNSFYSNEEIQFYSNSIDMYYKDFENMLTTDMTRIDILDNYIPQGVCTAGDHVIVSSYYNVEESMKDKALGKLEDLGLIDIEAPSKVNSVLDIYENNINIKRVKLLNESGGAMCSHVGGVAYDPVYNYLYVTGYSGKVLVYDYDEVLDYKNESVKPINTFDIGLKNAKGNKVTSYMTYFEGKIYVGTFNEYEDGIVKEFSVCPDGEITELSTFNVPPKTQGISFYRDSNNNVYRALSISYFRTMDSNIEISRLTSNGEFSKVKDFKLPPMLEQVTFNSDGTLQAVFESGAKSYDNNYEACLNIPSVVNLDIFNNLG